MDPRPAPARPRSPWLLVAGAVALIACTAALGVTPSVRSVGPDRVPDPVDAPEAWRLRGDRGGVSEVVPGGVHLRSWGDQRAVAWYDLGPLGVHRRWRVRAHVFAPRPAAVKVVLAASDGDRRLWIGSYRFETDTWTEVELPVNAPLHGLDVSVGVLLRGEAGEAWVDRVELVPVAPRAGWRVGLGALVALWLGWWWAWVRRAGWLAGGIALGIAAGVTLPRAWVDLVVGRWWGVRILESPVAVWAQKLGGHMGMFAVLGAALATRLPPAASVGTVLLIGGMSEALQLVSIARSASLVDVALDLTGGVIGVGLVSWWTRR